MKEEPAKQPPTREEVEMTKIVGSVKKVDSISNAISKIVKWVVILFIAFAIKDVLFELSRTPNQDTAQMIINLLQELLSEKGFFNVFMAIAGWVATVILVFFSSILVYLYRKQGKRLDELTAGEKGGNHERIADSHSDHHGNRNRLHS